MCIFCLHLKYDQKVCVIIRLRLRHRCHLHDDLNITTYPLPHFLSRHRLVHERVLPNPKQHHVRFVSGHEAGEKIPIRFRAY